MFAYTAYNLNVHSALSLPELAPGGRAADVMVAFGDVRLPFSTPADQGCIRATSEEALLFWVEVGAFSIRGGREIVIDPVPEVDERLLRLVILGPAMGAVLYQRGWMTLHASAVNVAGNAVAFMGEQGWGKSTMAAAMCARGHRLLADDITPVWIDGEGSPMVCPGYPQIKLWPDAVASLGEDVRALPRLNPLLEKRARPANREFLADPLPLRRIYVLGLGQDAELELLRPQESLLELIRHTYGRKLFQAMGTSAHFLKCASLANETTMYNLRRPSALSRLSESTHLVEEDLQASFLAL